VLKCKKLRIQSRVEICCIGNRGTVGDSHHPTSYLHPIYHDQQEDRTTPYHLGIRFQRFLRRMCTQKETVSIDRRTVERVVSFLMESISP
jgi:hypothetical protein